jgi:DNA-binding GntR family transcriptional regulator
MVRTLPVDKTRLLTSVYDALKERIMDQVEPPGARLNIDALAAELGVSPTPVREALTRLTAERLVTSEPYKGFRVTPLLSPEQVVDLMHVRRLIETDAARLAAPRIRTPDILSLERIISDSNRIDASSWSHGYKHFSQLDESFHETLLAMADNPFLITAFKSLHVHLELGRFYVVFQMTDHHETCVEHESILRALGARDAEGAAAAVEEHLHNTELRIFRLIDQHLYESQQPADAAAIEG